MKDGQNHDLIGFGTNLVDGDIGQAGNHPFPCACIAAVASHLREGAETFDTVENAETTTSAARGLSAAIQSKTT